MTDYLIKNHLGFNFKPSTIMHIDMNSCFASVEQQANPLLRGKSIAVCAYTTPSGCILAPSIEAKTFGVKTGMRVREGRLLCPNLIVLPSDPAKYRNIHLRIRKILEDYTEEVYPKSIDEFVLNLAGYPAYKIGMFSLGREIRERIYKEVGEWIRVSIGISTNYFLAKTAAGLKKPDGLEEINKNNFLNVYFSLNLVDLCGIKKHNAQRLATAGIYTVLDFYQADLVTLKRAFKSISGYYWYLRLRGWEIDDTLFKRRSFGNSFALSRPVISLEKLAPILTKLSFKAGARLRRAGYWARGVHLSLDYRDWGAWHHGKTLAQPIFDSRDIFREAYSILLKSPRHKPIRNLAVSCFSLIESKDKQLALFEDVLKNYKLTKALDKINHRWGDFVIAPLRMVGTSNIVPDRISFGGVKEIEEQLGL